MHKHTALPHVIRQAHGIPTVNAVSPRFRSSGSRPGFGPTVPDYLVPALVPTRPRSICHLQNSPSTGSSSFLQPSRTTSSLATTSFVSAFPVRARAIHRSAAGSSAAAGACQDSDGESESAHHVLLYESEQVRQWREKLSVDRPPWKLYQEARAILDSTVFVWEREVTRLLDASVGWNSFHGRFLFALLTRKRNVSPELVGSRAPGSSESLSWDNLSASVFRAMLRLLAPGSLHLHFLADLAHLSGRQSRTALLECIESATLETFDTARWRQRLHAEQRHRDRSLNAAASGTLADLRPGVLTGAHHARVGRVFLSLMKAYAHTRRFDKVHALFVRLTNIAGTPDMRHFQLELMAIFVRHYGFHMEYSKQDSFVPLKDLLDELTSLRSQMEESGVEPDDTFLATVVHGLGLPMRSPLSGLLSARALADTVEPPRSIIDAFLRQAAKHTQRIENKPASVLSKRAEAGPSSRSRLLSALLQVELDALSLKQPIKRHVKDPFQRIKQLVRYTRGQSGPFPASDMASGLDQARWPGVAMATYVQIRVLIGLGRLAEATSALPDLLGASLSRGDRLADANTSVQGWDPPDCDHRLRDLVLKQRSIVILLFSEAMKKRHASQRPDAAFEILNVVARHPSFLSTWGKKLRRGQLHFHPDHNGDGLDLDPISTLSRLWKRHLRAWSWNMLKGRAARGGRKPVDPWRTLSKSISTMLLTCSVLAEATEPHMARSRGSRVTPQYAQAHEDKVRRILFGACLCEKGTVRAMVVAAVEGERLDRPEEAADLLTKRVETIFELLRRARVRPREWEAVRATLLEQKGRLDHPDLGSELLPKLLDLLHRHRYGGVH